MDRKFSILIVEDHALTSFALKTSLLSLDFTDKIYEVTDALAAYKVLEENKPDLIIMDLGLPNIDGVEAISQIRTKNKDVKIIVLTSHSEREEVLLCLEAGISAYCTKDIKPQKLQEVIKDVIQGSLYFDSSVSKYVMQTTAKRPDDTFSNISIKDCYNLTQQEKRVLILLAGGYSNNKIAKKLNISVNTTKVHVCSILQKMGVEDRTQAAIKAIRENLINE